MDADDDTEPDFGQLFSPGVLQHAIVPAAAGAIVAAPAAGAGDGVGVVAVPAAGAGDGVGVMAVPAAGAAAPRPKRKHRRTHGLCGASAARTTGQKQAMAQSGAGARRKNAFREQRDAVQHQALEASQLAESF